MSEEGAPNLEDNKKKINELVSELDKRNLFDAGMDDLVIGWPDLGEALSSLDEMRTRQVVESLKSSIELSDKVDEVHSRTKNLIMRDIKGYLRYVLQENYNNKKDKT